MLDKMNRAQMDLILQSSHSSMSLIEVMVIRFMRFYAKITRKESSQVKDDVINSTWAMTTDNESKKEDTSGGHSTLQDTIDRCSKLSGRLILVFYIAILCFTVPSWLIVSFTVGFVENCDSELLADRIILALISLPIAFFGTLTFLGFFNTRWDNLKIKLELVLTGSLIVPCGTVFIVLKIAAPSVLYFPLLGRYFILVPAFIIAQFACLMYPVYLAIKNHEIVTIGLDVESFEKVLADKKLFQDFRRECQADLCMENVLFYEAYLRIEKNADVKSSLYKRFIEMGAPNELNLTDERRNQVQRSLASKSFEDFDMVFQDVKTMMFQNTFPRFIGGFKK